MTEAKDWIRKIQRSSDKTKRFWLVVLSGCAMTLVVFVWLVYITLTLPRLEGVEGKKEETAAEEEDAPFWEVLGKGVSIMTKQVWGEMRKTKEVLLNFKNTIQNTIQDFSIKPATEKKKDG